MTGKTGPIGTFGVRGGMQTLAIAAWSHTSERMALRTGFTHRHALSRPVSVGRHGELGCTNFDIDTLSFRYDGLRDRKLIATST